MTAALPDRATTGRTGTRAPARQTGPRLRVLDQEAARRRTRHRQALLILFMAVLVGFFGVAFVHADLVAGQNELDAVRAEISAAEARQAELARAVEEASAPAAIVERATEQLGMVPSGEPVYLTAAAPIREVEVAPALSTLIASESPAPVGTTAEVASPSDDPGRGSSPGADRALRGSLGTAGGISAAVRVSDDPTLALGSPADPTAGAEGSPVGVATSTPGVDASAGSDGAGESTGSRGGVAGTEVSTASAGITAVSGAVAAPSRSTSPVAGTTAVSGAVGAVASTPTNGMATTAAATGSQ